MGAGSSRREATSARVGVCCTGSGLHWLLATRHDRLLWSIKLWYAFAYPRKILCRLTLQYSEIQMVVRATIYMVLQRSVIVTEFEQKLPLDLGARPTTSEINTLRFTTIMKLLLGCIV